MWLAHKKGALPDLEGRLFCRLFMSIRLHFVALAALVLNRESVLALVVAGTAGLALFHVGHGRFEFSGLEREDLGVAVAAFVGLGMEFMAEDRFAGRGLELDFGRFHAFVALVAVTCRCKRVFAVVAGTAGFAFGHVIHGGCANHGFIGEGFRVAVFAAVCLGVECMAESGRRHPFDCKGDVFGFHPLVAAIAVCCHAEGPFTVMAGAAGTAFLHLGHGHSLFLAGDDLAVMASPAGSARLGYMD